MDPITQAFIQGAAGAGGSSTYVDDVFSNYLYTGQSTTKTITNGVDNLGEGGMLWVKNRDNARGHQLYDTERKASGSNTTSDHSLSSDSTGAARDMSPNGIVTWKNDGWAVLGGDGDIKQNGFGDYARWNFRKAPGFFDIVTFTETASDLTLNHKLGCMPGMIIFKRTNGTSAWWTYHSSLVGNASNGSDEYLRLNGTNTAGYDAQWGTITNSTFTFKPGFIGSGSGTEWIAYLFGGGTSTASTARSVDFDGSGDYLSTGSSSEFTMGTGDFTIECWVKFDDTSNRGVFQISDQAGGLSSAGGGGGGGTIAFSHNGSSWHVYGAASSHNTGYNRSINQWYHIAYTRSSGISRCFVDGIQTHEFADTHNYNGTYVAIGGYYTTSYLMQGEISNFRIIKGTALYTGGFRPSNKPLESITNTKLLCCNNSSVTGSTTSSGVNITSNGNPTASTKNPFTDSAGFVFGEEGDQQIIKCGMYQGYGSERYIDVGFEPQWVLAKNIDDGRNWIIIDDMRGAADITNNTDSRGLFPNINNDEVPGNYIGMTSRGFKLLAGESSTNKSGDMYIYMAIRRPDGHVGKPAEAGTNVFSITYGKNDNTLPTFVSNHVTDFTLFKNPTANQPWYSQERIHGTQYMVPSSTAAEANSGNNTWDFMDGYYKATGNWTTDMNWMWKRGAGFDVVNWNGNGIVTEHVHNLGRAPEFMIVKRRSATEDWTCYHKGLNGGTNPSHYYIQLNGTSGQGQYTNYEPGNPGNYNMWNREDPTSTHFTIGEHDRVNTNGQTYMALLFSSVEGISKVGYYSGNGSANLTITTGFQPRFLLIKRADGSGAWHLFDSVRGMGATDKLLQLNSNAAQLDVNYVTVSSTGWNTEGTSLTNGQYIYYAHA